MLDPRIIELMPKEELPYLYGSAESIAKEQLSTRSANKMRQDIIESLDGKVCLLPNREEVMKVVKEYNHCSLDQKVNAILKMLEGT